MENNTDGDIKTIVVDGNMVVGLVVTLAVAWFLIVKQTF
jgi:hypothetical protein